MIRKAAAELHSCTCILKWPVRFSLCEETFVKRLIVRNRLEIVAFDLAFRFSIWFLFSNLKPAPNRCCDTQRFICLADPKLFLLGPPQPHCGFSTPTPQCILLGIPIREMLGYFRASQGLFFSIISELRCMAPESESLHDCGAAVGENPSSGALSQVLFWGHPLGPGSLLYPWRPL